MHSQAHPLLMGPLVESGSNDIDDCGEFSFDLTVEKPLHLTSSQHRLG